MYLRELHAFSRIYTFYMEDFIRCLPSDFHGIKPFQNMI